MEWLIIIFLILKHVVMKKNLFLLVILTISVMISCDKDLQQTSTTPIDVRTDDPNYEAFENYLNQEYVDNLFLVEVPNVHEIPFTHTNGFITNTEKSRINSAIISLKNSGVDPQIIDLDIQTNVISVVENVQINSSVDFGPGVNPDGGISTSGSIVPGTFCPSGLPDNSGGGVGRVAMRFIRNHVPGIPGPSHLEDIKKIEMSALCVDGVTTSGGHISVTSDDFWQQINICNNEPSCLTTPSLNKYYQDLKDNIIPNLPQGRIIVGTANCIKSTLNPPPGDYWLFIFYHAKLVMHSGIGQ